MEKDRNNRKFESVFSQKVRAGRRRTYFFDVRKTKGEDYYITLTESTKKFNGHGYERHKIFLYKEDFNRFLESLQSTINHVKNELMPDYDYDEYTKKHLEWEEEAQAAATATSKEASEPEPSSESSSEDKPEDTSEETEVNQPDVESDDEMEW